MTDEEVAELRAYKPAEAARMLNIPITRLKRWVREDLVPHERAGVSRGVEFSAEDIRQIDRMRPQLMRGRRAGRQAEARRAAPDRWSSRRPRRRGSPVVTPRRRLPPRRGR